MPEHLSAFTRRDLLTLVGQIAGGAAMYQAMSSLGLAEESNYRGPIHLQGAPKRASVLILGAGIAGMVAALELRAAGYRVQVLEYNPKAGGRCWTLRGGDEYTELGGFRQQCQFAPGQYINPGPWRIPYHHHAMLDYCRRLGVALEPFVQINYNAYVHSSKAYGGKPQRFRHVQSDYQGHIAELFAKCVRGNQLDASLTHEDLERLLESLKNWGALDAGYRYLKSPPSSSHRGYDLDDGGGLAPPGELSQPLELAELLQSRLWTSIAAGQGYHMQPAIFQPVGGMDRIAQAFAREVGSLIRYNTRVFKIDQDDKGVTVNYTNRRDGSGGVAKADWCICTLPVSILSQLELNVSAKMKTAIDALPYHASLKAGLQFKRRFWEDDERIYGGITYTNLPITTIAYPNHGCNMGGKGVLLGAYMFAGNAFKYTAMDPAQRLQEIVAMGAQIHPQYTAEFENGITVGWHRVPWSNGCFGAWNSDRRAAYYEDMCQIDGRIVLAGEHVSRIPAWQEGAALSALDVCERLHRRALSA
ncbi:MAG: flavin monoamine oxidase family protein [Steroidobacterales bacterium]